MEIQLRDVTEVVEVNSTYLLGELRKKFAGFIESYDSLGLKIDGNFTIDLGNKEYNEDDVEDEHLEPPDIPAVWVLVDDSATPVFKPFITDEAGTDFDKALMVHGIDIIVLKTLATEKVKTIKIRMHDNTMAFRGNLREIQKHIIASLEYSQNRSLLLSVLKESFSDRESVNSFLMEIPAHSIHVVMGVTD